MDKHYALQERLKSLKHIRGISRDFIKTTIEEFDLELPEDRFIDEFISIESKNNKEFLIDLISQELTLVVEYEITTLKHILDRYNETIKMLNSFITPGIKPLIVKSKDQLGQETTREEDILELEVGYAIALLKQANIATALSIYDYLPNTPLPRFNLKPSYNTPSVKLGHILYSIINNKSKYVTYSNHLKELSESNRFSIKLSGEEAIYTSLIANKLTPLFLGLFKEINDNSIIEVDKNSL